MLANARRRAGEGRYDDAVARLYRAIEATGQLRLRTEHGIDASKVPFDRVPESLREAWAPYTQVHGQELQLPLQGVYRLLAALEDPLGALFQKARLSDPEKSPLTNRNQSILAHGYSPVSKKTFDDLWSAALNLAETGSDALPYFPCLGNVSDGE